MQANDRLSTGVPGLDEMLGGGLLPGTLTVAVGATGIGKTQLGLQFIQAGAAAEGRRGIVFDMTSRGDSQSHGEYAERMFGWRPQPAPAVASGERFDDAFFAPDAVHGDYLHVFEQSGRRVSRRDLEFEQWRSWKTELVQKLNATIAFLYGNFVQGVRRVVIDGIEPVAQPSDSIQLELFEYVYHQVLRKDPEWVARDLFREAYRRHAETAARHVYDPARIGCLMLYTSHASMLEQLIDTPLADSDILTNANTILYLGKLRTGDRLGRGLYVAKHRGSACSDAIAPYEITAGGLRVGA
ncbi:MAG: recombinase RecA [Pirellulales bacterium]|nr:recombinase RecA [Pirellulales bacterium]